VGLSGVISQEEWFDVLELLNRAVARVPVATLAVLALPLVVLLPGSVAVAALVPMPAWAAAVLFGVAGALCVASCAFLLRWRLRAFRRSVLQSLEAAVELLNDEFGERHLRWFLRFTVPTSPPAINDSDSNSDARAAPAVTSLWIEVEALAISRPPGSSSAAAADEKAHLLY
jgi:hypothetical protein